MEEENQGRECPTCGRITARGETECERCGTPMAVDPVIGSTSPRWMLWAGRAAAAAALLAPAAAIVAVMLGVGLISMHAMDREGAITALAGVAFGAAGYLLNGGFVLL